MLVTAGPGITPITNAAATKPSQRFQCIALPLSPQLSRYRDYWRAFQAGAGAPSAPPSTAGSAQFTAAQGLERVIDPTNRRSTDARIAGVAAARFASASDVNRTSAVRLAARHKYISIDSSISWN